MKFRVIEGTPAPDTPTERVRKRMRSGRPEYIAHCPRCGGIGVEQEWIGKTKRGGKLVGGTKVWVCANCKLAGKRVVIE